MNCIYCQHSTKITNSRKRSRDKSVWRRHKCDSCQAIFTTIEQIDWNQAVVFKSNDKHVEPFSRDKLLISVNHSLQHRKDAIAASTALTDTIISKLMPHIEQATLTRNQVIAKATEVLRQFDKAAAASYSAFHPLV